MQVTNDNTKNHVVYSSVRSK